jgi:hypothetical protein
MLRNGALVRYNLDMQMIPSTLAPFFQEYDLTQLEPQRDAATIIERTLRYGTRAELRWLFSTYSRSEIADWVHRWGAFGLPAPHLAFWRLVLGLPEAG